MRIMNITDAANKFYDTVQPVINFIANGDVNVLAVEIIACIVFYVLVILLTSCAYDVSFRNSRDFAVLSREKEAAETEIQYRY